MLLTAKELKIISQVYLRQTEFGIDGRTALNLATIIYLQRHPYESVHDGRKMLEQALAQQELRWIAHSFTRPIPTKR
jgi:hypothetical protein